MSPWDQKGDEKSAIITLLIIPTTVIWPCPHPQWSIVRERIHVVFMESWSCSDLSFYCTHSSLWNDSQNNWGVCTYASFCSSWHSTLTLEQFVQFWFCSKQWRTRIWAMHWTGQVNSESRDYYYYYHEFGTRFLRGRRFLQLRKRNGKCQSLLSPVKVRSWLSRFLRNDEFPPWSALYALETYVSSYLSINLSMVYVEARNEEWRVILASSLVPAWRCGWVGLTEWVKLRISSQKWLKVEQAYDFPGWDGYYTIMRNPGGKLWALAPERIINLYQLNHVSP